IRYRQKQFSSDIVRFGTVNPIHLPGDQMDKPVMPELSAYDSDDGHAHAHTPTRIASSLRELICKGNLRPGTKLSEETIAAEFEVSRNTLREAFTVLAGENLVYKVPNRGVFVIDPGLHDVREIYQ